jgi:ribosome biogenesis protein YTM1
MERNPPPSLDEEHPHNDWVSAVQCNDHFILTGSYDNSLRLWDHHGKLLASFPGHDKQITDVAWLPDQPQDGHMTFLSSSHDQHVHVWKMDIESMECNLTHVCKGHSQSIETISRVKGNKFITGGWDKYIKIWSTDDGNNDNVDDSEETVAKRPHMSNSESKPKSKVPIATLAGHTHSITSISWFDDNSFYSAGHDHCIREWDVTMGINKNTLNGSNVFLDIDVKPNCNMIASGHTDKHVRIWDVRNNAPSLISCTLSSHRGWIKQVAWSPSSDHQLVSGSYDKMVKLWDIRSSKSPLYTIAAHDGKVLCLDWSIPQMIATGGADNVLRTYSV